MNEKIKELAEQAEKYANEQAQRAWHHSSGFNPFKEKFAELIVQECIGIVEKQKAKMSYGPTFVIEDIKQHFGIGEL